MYAMLDQEKSSIDSKEKFMKRNSKIYEGIEMSDLSITDITKKTRKRKCGSFIQQIYETEGRLVMEHAGRRH